MVAPRRPPRPSPPGSRWWPPDIAVRSGARPVPAPARRRRDPPSERPRSDPRAGVASRPRRLRPRPSREAVQAG
ncbi:MAG: hypothetical protein CBD91_06350 [Phycisphaeraceae bacterium TMED231]|nr:MAG: hypothetical protein CBD91_06350 [Phycisphaeraceae bacterium TMED231]